MRMTSLISLGLSGVLTLMLFTTVQAQQPDLTGTWKLVPERSDIPPAGGRAGGWQGRGGGMADAALLGIARENDKIMIRWTASSPRGEREMVTEIIPDGRPHTNVNMLGGEVITVAEWKNGVLVFRQTQAAGAAGRQRQAAAMSVEWKYRLEQDGSLIVERTIQTQQGALTSKLVYVK